MVPFQIKICGVTKVDDAIFACRSGADAIGLNFYEPSSRYVCPPGTSNSDSSKDDAAQIVAAIRGFNESQNASPVKVVGVFVNLESSQVVDIANDLGLDGIQLHGDEPASDAEKIRQAIGPKRPEPVLVVRAIRTNTQIEPNDLDAELGRIEAEISRWAKFSVDAVLLDAAVAGEFGGTGKSVDWHSVPKIKSPVPIILAGGLTAKNVHEAIQISGAEAVDVASGVESNPGKKDHSLVQQFIRCASASFKLQSSGK